MRAIDHPALEARLLARAVAVLRQADAPVTFAELCLTLGCQERAPGDREVLLLNGAARRERAQLTRALERAERQGILRRTGGCWQLGA